MRKDRNGSTIFLILIIAGAIALGVGTLMRGTLVERGNNHRYELSLEAARAAEAAIEMGMAEVAGRFETSLALNADIFSPAKNPIRLPAVFSTNYTGSRVILPPANSAYAGTAADFALEGTNVFGGLVPARTSRMISASAPGSEFDPQAGITALTSDIMLYAKGRVVDPHNIASDSYVEARLEVRDIPLFAHAVFYNMDMEIHPGPKMDVFGPVHSNGDMYITAGSSGLNFHKRVTATGDMYHGTYSGIGKSVSTGPVKIKDGADVLTSMKVSSTWWDSDLTDWRDKSAQRWDGRVQSADHGVGKFNPVGVSDYVRDDPDTAATDDPVNEAYQLIQRPLGKSSPYYDKDIEEQKFAYKAGLTIKVSPAGAITMHTNKRLSGTDKMSYADGDADAPDEIALTDPGGIVTYNGFAVGSGSGTSEVIISGMRDKRRSNKGLDTVEIDMGALNTSLTANSAGDWGEKPDTWWNGIVYVDLPTTATTGTDGVSPGADDLGVVLKNGSTVPKLAGYQGDSGLGTTVATNNVLYVQGDYNADGTGSGSGTPTLPDSAAEGSCALVADAITLLSNNWNPTKSAKTLNNRIASATEVSAALLTGIAPSNKGGNGKYSGGVENFPRFLEKWSGKDLVYRGSMVCLFESEIATQKWKYGGNYYKAPRRKWGFHSKFGEGYYPPGTPNVRSFVKTKYKLLTKTEWAARVTALKSDFNL